MSFGRISNLTSSYLQSILGSALQTAGLSSSTNAASAGQATAVQQPAFAVRADPEHLAAIELFNPQQYQQVTQQIATNLQNARRRRRSRKATPRRRINRTSWLTTSPQPRRKGNFPTCKTWPSRERAPPSPPLPPIQFGYVPASSNSRSSRQPERQAIPG